MKKIDWGGMKLLTKVFLPMNFRSLRLFLDIKINMFIPCFIQSDIEGDMAGYYRSR